MRDFVWNFDSATEYGKVFSLTSARQIQSIKFLNQNFLHSHKTNEKDIHIKEVKLR
jgi:hypothetical protein